MMHQPIRLPLVSTIRERCRVCYTCVRECPAKAISVSSGQAEVIPDRCIGCGNCVRVCSQNAKRVLNEVPEVRAMIASGARVAAIVAPSFPAEFKGLDHRKVVGMLRALGFSLVNEVAFGADLVADRYRRLLAENPDQHYIATNCPAIMGFVERYYPGSAGALAPIVSPMIAAARALRQRHGDDLRVVFIGPCVAKKIEAMGEFAPGEVEAALSFAELKELLEEERIAPDQVEPSEFDPPLGGIGVLFPISRGMLQAARLSEDLLSGDIVAVDGRRDFVEAIRQFDSGDLSVNLLEVLACSGCIMGPGMTCALPLFTRRTLVSQYAREKLARLDQQAWRQELDSFAELDLHRYHYRLHSTQNLYSYLYSPMFADDDLRRQFSLDDQQQLMPTDEELAEVLRRMGKFTPEDELNCAACGYDTCREHAVAVWQGLAETEMCLPYTIDRLNKTVVDLAESHDELTKTQQALMKSERLASMGQLAAGIAHEVNNPLGVVLLYAHMILDAVPRESDMFDDAKTIVEEADRCKKIVSGLLNFARRNKVTLQDTDLAALVERCLKVMQIPPGVDVQATHEHRPLMVRVDPDQIIQVLTNLIGNAVAAMHERGRITIATGRQGEDQVYFAVSDTGCGISKENLNKVFEPFFTTKQTGKGTGLGLAVTYGIVKMHRGQINVETNDDPQAGPTGATFKITLPRVQQDELTFEEQQ